MKYNVKVEGRQFEVEIDNLHTQPIIALVDGEPLEIWTEQQTIVSRPKGPTPAHTDGTLRNPSSKSLPAITKSPNGNGFKGNGKAIRAPIPGTITSVRVIQGTEVTVGQDLCVLEAMKMKNAIRSPRNGVISAVHVTPGQTVQHHDILVEFTE